MRTSLLCVVLTLSAARGADVTALDDAKRLVQAQVAPAAPPAPAAGELKLNAVLQTAAENSPAVRAAQHRWLAAAQKHAQAIALPDPQFQAEYFFHRVDDQAMYSVTQAVPYPGKLVIAGRMANREAEAARLRYDAALRDALADAKESFFELFYLDRAEDVTRETEKLYERYAALAAGGVQTGQAQLPETFRAESQRAQLANDLILLREIRVSETARLRTALGVHAEEFTGRTQDIAEPAPLNATIEALQALAAAHNQELAAAGVELARSELGTKLAHRAPIPDVSFGAAYVQKTMGTEGAVTAGITLPLWVPKYRAQAREAAEMEQAARADRDAQALKLDADLAKAYFSLNNSQRLVRLYRQTLLPQARQAQQSAETLYRAGQANLASVIETASTVQNFELARLRATADFYQNVSRVERVLGTALPLGTQQEAPK